MRIALSIAGSDPTGGAGLQADVQVFRAFGLHGAAIPTALTIQDSSRVHRVLPVFPSLILEQIRGLLADITPNAIKIGMLASDDVVRNVTLALGQLEPDVPVLIDPVLAASDGTRLLEQRAWPALRGLMHGCRLVTPNLPEAQLLSEEDVSTRSGCEAAARIFIGDFGARAVLIKGGHREGDVADLLAVASDNDSDNEDAPELKWLEAEPIEIESPGVHGTGCALSSAIAAGMALGRPLEQSVLDGRRFVREAIRLSERVGKGSRFLVLPGAAT